MGICWGIIGAMEVEVEKLIAKMDSKEQITVAGMNFYKGKYAGSDAVIVRSGVGKVNAAVCTQILVDRFGVDRIINTGIGGSLNAAIDIADIVVSTDAMQHDVDATVWGYGPGCIPQMESSVFTADEALRKLAVEGCKCALTGIKAFEGRIISGDQFVSDKAVKDRLATVFKADCTEMEGAAIAQTACLNKVPFVILRAISDKADGSAVMDYNEFEIKAIANSVELVDYMIKNS